MGVTQIIMIIIEIEMLKEIAHEVYTLKLYQGIFYLHNTQTLCLDLDFVNINTLIANILYWTYLFDSKIQ